MRLPGRRKQRTALIHAGNIEAGKQVSDSMETLLILRLFRLPKMSESISVSHG